MKKLLLFLSLLFVSISFAFSADAKSVPAPFNRGVNFSSWLEFKNPSEINFGYFTKEDFENVKKMGCDVVRLPVHFEQLSSGKPDYKVDPVVWEILDNVTKWANELNIYVIIDFHNNTAGGSQTPFYIEDILLKIWDQISKRYSKAGKYICYEVYNEPHGIDVKRWGQIEGKVISKIRENDKNHYIICGGADWNSFEALKVLPDWDDDKLMYTFHFYDPYLFTHQGASWTEIARIKNIPFPYDESRMPSLPANPSSQERWYMSPSYNYKQKGTEKAVADFFDQYVKFSLEKNAPVFCGEFGVYMAYAEPKERVNWYRIVTDLLDQKGIAHTSWDYYGSFGVFKSETETLFPQDLNREIVEAMKLKVPEGRSLSWFENASSKKDFTLYENGYKKGLDVNFWNTKVSLYEKIDSKTRGVKISEMEPWAQINTGFREVVDFSTLMADNYKLVITAKNSEPNLKLQVWFQDNGSFTNFEWRASITLTAKDIPNDGKFHDVVIPLSRFQDVGAWDNRTSSWVNSQKKFDWSKIDTFVFAGSENKLSNELLIKNIKIEK